MRPPRGESFPRGHRPLTADLVLSKMPLSIRLPMVNWQSTKFARGSFMVGIAAMAGVLIGLVLVPRSPTPGDTPPPAPEVRLLGAPLALNADAVPTALERVRRYASSRFDLRLPDGTTRPLFLSKLGAEIDSVRLARLVRDARDHTSPLRREWERRGTAEPLVLPVPIIFPVGQAVDRLISLKDEVDRLPEDARLDFEQRKVVQERAGRLLDVDASLGSLHRAVAAGERQISLSYEELRPRRVAAELKELEFDSVLGYFETRYNRSAQYRDRTFNLRLAASKLDGHVLLPGDEFDFNGVVGPRDEANGYKVATVIAEGELVDGIGGGTCQISGTLHGAAFFAGLGIVERYPHTRPSAYIKMGLDATVVYPTINFKLRNTYSFPVVLHETVKNGVVRAEILGANRSRTVTLIRRIMEALPYEQVERPDDALAAGERVLAQRGVAGFKLKRYRIVREGLHAVRERWNDTYPPTTQIVRVGTAQSASKKAKVEDDPHPEYVADELLVMTQGPGLGSAEEEAEGGPTLEQREPGRFGNEGWTKAAGMPFWGEIE